MDKNELKKETKRIQNQLDKEKEKNRLTIEYELIYELIYKVFAGQMLVQDLIELCDVFDIATESRVEKMLKESHKLTVETRQYDFSSNRVVMLKKHLTKHFNNGKDVGSISYNDNTVRLNSFKTRLIKHQYGKTKINKNIDTLVRIINESSTLLIGYGDFESSYKFWKKHFELSELSNDKLKSLRANAMISKANLKRPEGDIAPPVAQEDTKVNNSVKNDAEAIDIEISPGYLVNNYIYTFIYKDKLNFYIFNDKSDLKLKNLSKKIYAILKMLYTNLEASPINGKLIGGKNANLLKRIKIYVYCFNQSDADALYNCLETREIVYVDVKKKLGPSVEYTNLLVKALDYRAKQDSFKLAYQEGFEIDDLGLDKDFIGDGNSPKNTMYMLNTALDTREYTFKLGLIDSNLEDRLTYYKKAETLAKTNINKKKEEMEDEIKRKFQGRYKYKEDKLNAKEKELKEKEEKLKKYEKLLKEQGIELD